MRSLKYANDVIEGKRSVPDNVKVVARDFKAKMDQYLSGDYEDDAKRLLVKNLISFDTMYMTEDDEPCDALVFATMVSLLYDNSLFVVPRKNGKTSVIVHMMRFFHIFYDELTIGIFSNDRVICNIVRCEAIKKLKKYDILCKTIGNSMQLEGKNNQYVLISDNSLADIGYLVDIVLVDEFLGLSNMDFNKISFKQIKAVSTIYHWDNTLKLKDVMKKDIFDNYLLYTTENKEYGEITTDDIIKSNPLVENEYFYNKRDNNTHMKVIRRMYERGKYITASQREFKAKHLNMVDFNI